MTRPIYEADVQREILSYLGSQRWCRLFRSTTGLGLSLDGKRTVRHGLCVGASDLIGIVAPHGRFLAIEVKRPGGTATPQQVAFLQMIRDLGGIAFVARSLEDAKRQLAEEGYPR